MLTTMRMIRYHTHCCYATGSNGARDLMWIQTIGASNHQYADIGDIIVAIFKEVFKEAMPHMPLEKSELIRDVVVRTCKELKRDNSIMIIQYIDIVVDNSGARKLMCLQIIGDSNPRSSNIIVAVFKEAVPHMPLEKYEVIRDVVVRTWKELKHDNSMITQYIDIEKDKGFFG